jgi:pimeloyl-ACP methyl ester carboxylesterase
MVKNHYVIIVPGLGDQVRKLTLLTNHFHRHGLVPIVHNIGWNDTRADFAPKLERFLTVIDAYAKTGRVSLVGCSAGGSAVVNAFVKRKNSVHKVVSISGILRPSRETGIRSYERRTRSSKPFAQSVKLCANSERTLTNIDRRRIMTVYPKFGDELVAPDSAILPGAVNIQVPFGEHVLSIALALTVFSKQIIEFLLC